MEWLGGLRGPLSMQCWVRAGSGGTCGWSPLAGAEPSVVEDGTLPRDVSAPVLSVFSVLEGWFSLWQAALR